jgi:hypothetical protein
MTSLPRPPVNSSAPVVPTSRSSPSLPSPLIRAKSWSRVKDVPSPNSTLSTPLRLES